jgi:hypothetical protein
LDLSTVPDDPPPRRRRTPDGPIRSATLGSTAKAGLTLIVWCKSCRREIRLGRDDITAQVKRYGADTPVPDWAPRLRCSKCGSREVDFIITGARR